MSTFNAFVYNVLTMGVIFPWLFIMGPGTFPHGNLFWAIIIGFSLQVPLSLTYTWLGSVFPHSGGDYTFQTKIIGQGFGFTVVFSGFVIWVMQWLALSGWMISVLGFSPLFLGLGVVLHQPLLIHIGLTVQHPYAVVFISVIFSGLATLLLMAGFRHYVKVQQAIFFLTMTGLTIMIVVLFSTSPPQFMTAFNHFSHQIAPTQHMAQAIVRTAHHHGLGTVGTGGLIASIALAPITWIHFQWSTYSVEQGDQIPGQRDFRRHLAITLGSLAFTAGLLLLLAAALTHGVGHHFLAAYSYTYNHGIMPTDLKPLPNLMAIVLLQAPGLIILVSLGYIANSFQIFANCYIGMTRIVSAMVDDHQLPSWLANHSGSEEPPRKIYGLYSLLAIAWIVAYNVDPHWIHYTFEVTLANGYVFVASGGLAAILLAFRQKSAYQKASVPHTRWLGLPIVTWMGTAGLLTGGYMILALVFNPQYGASSSMPFLLLLGILLVSLVWYMLTQTYRNLAAAPLPQESHLPDEK